MEPSNLLKHLANTLDALGVPYLVTGSMASIAYGKPRFTNDIGPGVSPLCGTRLARGVRLAAGADFEATFAAPEDVIVKKLQYFREGGSEKHLRDIVGVLKVQGERIDCAYLADWIARLGLDAEWTLIEERLKEVAG